ncbi:MAG: S8 family serine peptidase [Polyangiaceae bacterium]|nr:S8 family serine peptidase [Polyangiaceae bacterium]
MDPALWELIESGEADDEVSVVLRLDEETRAPAGVRVVSRFGKVVTARVRRSDIRRVWESDEVISVKGPRRLISPHPYEDDAANQEEALNNSASPHPWPKPIQLPEDGTGVVVGICDWGFDFTHTNFRKADGTTRLIGLWDQNGNGEPPRGFDYGRFITPAMINAALRTSDPFSTLGYHPTSRSQARVGSHGTHVADILAGNRREPGSRVGLASGADLLFVHLGADRQSPLGNFGDSVRLLEGVDFLRREAGDLPCVIHLSAGKTGGAHRGETPFEQAIDAMLVSRPGIALCQSAGNYSDAGMHTHVRIGPNQSYVIVWMVAAGDRTPTSLKFGTADKTYSI